MFHVYAISFILLELYLHDQSSKLPDMTLYRALMSLRGVVLHITHLKSYLTIAICIDSRRSLLFYFISIIIVCFNLW